MTQSDRNAAFRRRLKELMDARGLTQSGLAAEIWGRTVNTEGKDIAKGRDRISVWVSGRNFPDRENLEKLAKRRHQRGGDA